MQPVMLSLPSVPRQSPRSSLLEVQSYTGPPDNHLDSPRTNPRSILPTIAPRTTKRARTNLPDKILTPKRQTKMLHTYPRRPLKLTKSSLTLYNAQYDESTASFDQEVRSRATQEAGKQMGFNLKLDCYKQPGAGFTDWIESQHELFQERPIFKDSQDFISVDLIAKAFDAAPTRDAGVEW
ncbi:hypothetical protein GQ44DRAFT_831329 [Phaeosphaeriaceae sp. PMI808]|nr:hypothetical protein GQ44DRAFT_831329 [Phaeosphaeriaceae sp. PMI808]